MCRTTNQPASQPLYSSRAGSECVVVVTKKRDCELRVIYPSYTYIHTYMYYTIYVLSGLDGMLCTLVDGLRKVVDALEWERSGTGRVKAAAWLVVGWYHGDEGREMLRDEYFPDLPQFFYCF